MNHLHVDMWYGDTVEDADKIDISFSDCDCVYRGNIWKNGKMIGDYWCDDCAILEKLFPQLNFNWDKQ